MLWVDGMIEICIESKEFFDERTNEFVVIDGGAFRFEHSLKAISLWESKYKVPFLKGGHEQDKLKAYYKYMAIGEAPNELLLTRDVEQTLAEYMGDPYSATIIQNEDKKHSARIITSEVIYAMMAISGVPFECEDWNLNRLLITLQVIGIESSPKKKMKNSEVLKQNRDLNEARKNKFKTKG